MTGPRHGEPPYHLADVGLDGAMQLRSRGFARVDLLERREDQGEELREPRVLARAGAPGLQRSLHGTTALMTEDHEKRRREVLQRIGQATENLGPYHADKEENSERPGASRGPVLAVEDTTSSQREWSRGTRRRSSKRWGRFRSRIQFRYTSNSPTSASTSIPRVVGR